MIEGKECSSLLDVGSGSGLLRQLGLKSIAFDLVHNPNLNLVASAEALPFRDESFDLIFAGEVIEHLRNPSKALRDWVRALKSDGTLIISTPNGILVGIEGNNPSHKFTFSLYGLESSLAALGLKAVSAKTIYTGLIGKRIFDFLPDGWKMPILRLPIPSVLSYDMFIKFRKQETEEGTGGRKFSKLVRLARRAPPGYSFELGSCPSLSG